MQKRSFSTALSLFMLLSSLGATTAAAAQWRTGYYSPIFPIGSGGMPASEVHYGAYTHVIHVTLIASNAQGAIDSTTYGLTPTAIQNFISGARATGAHPILQLSQLAGQTNLTQSINNGYLNTLVTNVMSYVNTYGYDGVDLDWEVDLGSNATNFQALVNAFRAQLPRSSGKLLLATFGGDESIAAANAANLDQVNLQCYDLAAASWGLVWHNSALYNLSGYTYPGGGDPAYTVQWRANSHLAAGVPAAKIGIGIPFYGYVWSGGTAPGQTGGSYSARAIEYRDLVTNPTLWQTAYMQRDPNAGDAPYLSIPSANQFVTYPEAKYETDQWNYTVNTSFGGLMVWDVGSDWNQSGATMADKHPLSEALRVATGGGTVTPSGPTISGGSPTGTLSASTTSTTLSVATNVNATCRYATVAGTAYSAMPYMFSVTGGTGHSATLVGLQSGTAYNYFVRCQDTLGNVDTTDYPISFTLASPIQSAGPMTVLATPISGSGSSNAFTFQVYDPNGTASIQQVNAVFDTVVGQANSCYVEYAPSVKTIYLKSSDNSVWLQAALGSSTTLQNNECSVNPAASSVSVVGNTLNLKLAMGFASTYTGTKSIFGFAADTSLSTGWQNLGTWIVTAPPVTAGPPTVQMTPNSGFGSGATFTLGISDTGGSGNVAQGDLIIGTVGAKSNCYIDYNAAANTLSLLSDDNTTWSHATVGSSVVLQNSQCSVNAGAATVSGSGNILTLRLPVTFTKNYTGTRTLNTFAADKTGQSSGWKNSGNWTVGFGNRNH
jgi:hypothetical protein